MDSLNQQLNEIDAGIQKALLRLQLIKKIKSNKISVPSIAGIESEQNQLNFSAFDTNNMDKLFADIDELSKISMSKNFIERARIQSPDKPFIAYSIMNTPTFMTENNESINRVVIGLCNDGVLKIYSIQSGNLISEIDLHKTFADHNISHDGDLENDLVQFAPQTTHDAAIVLLYKNGDLIELDFGIKSLNITQKSEDAQENANQTQSNKPRRRRNQSMRVPKTLSIHSVSSYNIWDVMIETNSTTNQPIVDRLKLQEVVPIHLNYYGRHNQGNYIILCSDDRFYLFRKFQQGSSAFKFSFSRISNAQSEMRMKNNLYSDKAKANLSSIDYDFKISPTIKHFSRQNVLVIFSQAQVVTDTSACSKFNHYYDLDQSDIWSNDQHIKDSKNEIAQSQDTIGFMRAYDGQIANSVWELGTHKIVALEHDTVNHGLFYVGIETGEIIVLRANTENKNEITCNIHGKLASGNMPTSNESTENYSIKSLKQFLIKYTDKGVFKVYNLTDLTPESGIAEYAKIEPVDYTPDYETMNIVNNTSVGLMELPTVQGNDVIFRPPGTNNELMIIEVINQIVVEQSWLSQLFDNRAFMFAIAIIVVFVYRMFTASQKKPSRKSLKNDFKSQNDSSISNKSDQLSEIAKRIQKLDSMTESVSKYTEDMKKGMKKSR